MWLVAEHRWKLASNRSELPLKWGCEKTVKELPAPAPPFETWTGGGLRGRGCGGAAVRGRDERGVDGEEEHRDRNTITGKNAGKF